ncbi:MAG: outer membrane protein assembly factor BamA, partial [Bacteroidales bacterium]|nr:outer membrane protein assembly factor BamA [Bacteroidales bacterium]
MNLNRRFYKIFLLWVSLFLLIPVFQVMAQEEKEVIDYAKLPVFDYSNPREYVIAEITISGVEFLQPMVLKSMSGLREGGTITVPGDDMTRVIHKFWDQGLFSDVKLTATRVEAGKIWIDIYLKEQPRLTLLEINGLKKSEKEDLTEKLTLRRGSQITTDLMNNTVRIIKEHFIEKGFLNTDVDIVQKADSASGNGVQLFIEIKKNDRVKIEEIYFVGNEVFTQKRLKRTMKDTKKYNWNIFKASKLIKDTYKEDKKKLLAFYNENGYRDAKILRDSISVLNDKRVDLTIWLEEGNKYFFRNIEWIGNTVYPSELLSRGLGIDRGDVFDQTVLDKRLQMDEDAVSSLYLDNGYLFFQVDPVEVRIENDSIDFEMRIHEGEQATINEVIITGNTKTNEHVIRREIRTKPGALFSKAEIIRT